MAKVKEPVVDPDWGTLGLIASGPGLLQPSPEVDEDKWRWYYNSPESLQIICRNCSKSYLCQNTQKWLDRAFCSKYIRDKPV